ncbi:unnamed protein product [Chondrus crispus]|uniref:Uncharacterized protein n=1 Tax=Chondrus crispus TaxID=2769 RepID=R7Q9Q6_CHOCR|nr:unnamed protein product [Chondrus crispus]CDF34121.1 unnamed protein product [Chondrus crispus]|eukprot:XP_005713940.1 unnamed protein product [Chondrus crispus]
MSFRTSLFRTASRRMNTAAEAIDKTAAKGPKLPAGNDPSASHGAEHAIADTNRWRIISAVFALPVSAYFIINMMNTHEHTEAPPEYPYLKMATRSPRFPWGEEDLIGTIHDKHARELANKE